jgi:RNA polymerase sigma-70 factor (sigma-E family)
MKPPPSRAGADAPLADDPQLVARGTPSPSRDDSGAAVTALYREHALGLIRLAFLTQGNRAAAEDIVQEAFCGLYRRWDHLSSTDKALAYLRSSVLNGCRNAGRRSARAPRVTHLPPADSAESAVLISELRREVIATLRRLPPRQREALVLRFYLDLSDSEIAEAMRISVNTMRSTLRRAIAALGIALEETS